MKPCYLLLDVGGTEIKINALAGNQWLYSSSRHVPSLASETKLVIVEHLQKLLLKTIEEIEQREDRLQAIGFAFPGPFDYENGISLMQDFRKYDALYLVNLRQCVQEWLKNSGRAQVPIIFGNDARCFALGEYHANSSIQKGIYLTLGTGCGSTFIEHGRVVGHRYGLNAEGMLYDTPFKEGVLDEYLSVNGLRQLAEDKNYPFENGKKLAKSALDGDKEAAAIFQAFGQLIGEGISSFTAIFEPEEIVFGGQLSKSMPLFKETLLQELQPVQPNVRVSEDPAKSTLKGLYRIILDQTRGEEDV